MPRTILGATGKFPWGTSDPTDEGELQIALVADHTEGIVRVDFGKRIAWIGLPANQARDIANLLLKKADELDTRKA